MPEFGKVFIYKQLAFGGCEYISLAPVKLCALQSEIKERAFCAVTLEDLRVRDNERKRIFCFLFTAVAIIFN